MLCACLSQLSDLERGVAGEAATAADMAALVNRERVARGLATLALEPVLVEEANRRAQRMSDSGSIFHTMSLDPSVGPVESWGENVGRGVSIEAIHASMMRSGTHLENILDPAFTSIGVGIERRVEGLYVAHVFVERPSGYAIQRLVAGGGATEGITQLSSTWHFAEGATWPGFDTYIVMANPSDGAASATVEFSSPAGRSGTHTLGIPAGGRATIHVNDLLGRGEVAASVTADRPIAAMRSLFVADGFVSDGAISPGAPSPSTAWYLPEGYTGPGFRTYVVLYNPGDSGASARLTYMTPDGSAPGRTVDVRPRSRATVLVNDDVPGREVSTLVESQTPLVVERTQIFEFRGVRGVHNSGGYRSPVKYAGFAEGYTGSGYQEYVLIQNPLTKPVTARVTLLTGGEQKRIDVLLGPHSRATVDVNAEVGPGREVATLVETSAAILAERVMYFAGTDHEGGTSARGASPATSWLLPEGYTGPGFRTYVLLANLGAEAATAQLTYLTEAGPLGRSPVTVPAMSRVTVDAGRDVDGSFGVLVTSDRAVLVEEAEYFQKSV